MINLGENIYLNILDGRTYEYVDGILVLKEYWTKSLSELGFDKHVGENYISYSLFDLDNNIGTRVVFDLKNKKYKVVFYKDDDIVVDYISNDLRRAIEKEIGTLGWN